MGGDVADCGDITEGWLSSVVVIVGIFGRELEPEPSEGIARPLAPLFVVDMACDVITMACDVITWDLVEGAPGGD